MFRRSLACLVALLGLGLTGCHPVEDGTPRIVGSSVLGPDQVLEWWDSTGRGQPPALTAPIGDVLLAYLGDGAAEGVRGDLALAQAILETGWFNSANASINNFAGIGFGRDGGTGYAFPDAATGVRAHVQLLRRYADGNEATLALPDVAPLAGGHAVTWGELSGTWAADPDYWPLLASIHARMCS